MSEVLAKNGKYVVGHVLAIEIQFWELGAPVSTNAKIRKLSLMPDRRAPDVMDLLSQLVINTSINVYEMHVARIGNPMIL